MVYTYFGSEGSGYILEFLDIYGCELPLYDMADAKAVKILIAEGALKGAVVTRALTFDLDTEKRTVH